MMRAFVPNGVVRLRDWQGRFRAVGLRAPAAWRAAMSPSMRRALTTSRIEHLPREFRSGLSFVVDVGANVGQWLLSFRRFVSIGRIEAFEPNPEVFEMLRWRLGGDPRVRVHNLALGEQIEVRKLYVTRASEMASVLPPSERLYADYSAGSPCVIREVAVPVTTLDAVVPSQTTVDLLKIDVQGFERRVLAGGRATLERTRAVLIEMSFAPHYKGDDTAGALYEYLTRDLGFEFWDMSPPHRASDGRALWVDAVFVNEAVRPARGWCAG